MSGTAPARGGWLAFWNGRHAIYVSERHRQVHYAKVADDILALAPAADARVLDFGCGEALDSPRIAARVGHLFLAEAADAPRIALAARLAGVARIEVISAEEVRALPDTSLDLVVVNSVVQYITPAELDAWLAVFRAKLGSAGRLVVADVIPPDAGALSDAWALLTAAARHGFLLAALQGLALSLLGDYRRLRRDLGLTRYGEATMLAKLTAAGLAAERRMPNFGFNAARMTFVAVPAAPARTAGSRPVL